MIRKYWFNGCPAGSAGKALHEYLQFFAPAWRALQACLPWRSLAFGGGEDGHAVANTVTCIPVAWKTNHFLPMPLGLMGTNMMTQHSPPLCARTLSGLSEKMPHYGRGGAGGTHSGFSGCRQRRVDFRLQALQSPSLLKNAFYSEVSPAHPSLEWDCKLCLSLLLLTLLPCVPVVAKQQRVLVSFPLENPELAQNKTSVLLPESEKLSGGSTAAPIFPPDLTFRKEEQGSGFGQGDAGERTEEETEERESRLHPPTMTQASPEGRREQEKQLELEADSRAEDANFEIDPLKIPATRSLHWNSALTAETDVRRSIGSQNPADPAVTSSKVSVVVLAKTPSESSSPLQTQPAAAATTPPMPLAWSVPSDANETPSTSPPDSSSSSKAEWSVAPAPRDSSSPFGFSLQEALRFPASLLTPLRAAFAPSTPLREKTSPPPTRAEISRTHSESDDTQQNVSGDAIESAVQLLQASLRWSNTFAEDIQKRIFELTGQKSPHNHVNKGILGIVGNIRHSLSGKNDPAREVEENKGDAPAGGGDPTRKIKKPLPPFDKQTRKHMSYVREWFTVSVGATMNGMRDQDEDALVVSAALQNFPNARMFSLFDGHAGQEAARRCSANASRIFGQLSGLSPAALKQGCLELDERIRNYPGPCLKSGSTGVIAIVKAVELPSGTFFNIHMANVGDSRAFLLHMTEDTYEILTRDHKPNQVEELQRIQKAGGCVRRIHKRVWRVNGFLALSRSFGDFALKRVASKTPEEQQVTAVPGTSTATARPGDYLLLGCDGVFEGEGMSWDFVARLLKESVVFFGGDIAATVNHLIDIAFALGSRDNISILLIKFTNKKLAPQVKRFEIEVDGTARELPVEILPGRDISTSTAGVYKGEHSLLVTLFS